MLFISNLIGFVLPPFIDLINVKIANNVIKFWISMAVCVLIGVATNLDKLTTDPDKLLANIGLIFAESQVVYHTYWKQSTARQELTKRI
jgi:hypothetical protein